MLQVYPPLHSVPGDRLAQGLPVKSYQVLSMQVHHMLQRLDKGLEAQKAREYYTDLVLTFLSGLTEEHRNQVAFTSLSSHEYLGKVSPDTQIYLNIQAPDDRSHMINSRSLNRLSFYQMIMQGMDGLTPGSEPTSPSPFFSQFIITNLYEWYAFSPYTLRSLLLQSPDLISYYEGYKEGKPAFQSLESLYRLIDQSHDQFTLESTYFNLYGIKEGLGKFDKPTQDRLIPLSHFLDSLCSPESGDFPSPLLLEKELAHLLGVEKVFRADLPYYRLIVKPTGSILADASQQELRRGLFFLHRSILQQYLGNEGLIQLEKGGILDRENRKFTPKEGVMYPYPESECLDLDVQKALPPLTYWERIQQAQSLSPHFRLALIENHYAPLDAGLWTHIWLSLHREKSTEPQLVPASLGPLVNTSLKRLIIQTFNTQWNWECTNWEDLQKKVEQLSLDETKATLLSIKVCDPAAGLGQMLLLLLNELSSLFAELGCLTDTAEKRLFDIQFKRVGWGMHPFDKQRNLIEYPLELSGDSSENLARKVHEGIFQIKWDIIHTCLFGICPSPYHTQVATQLLLLSLLSNRYQYKGKQQLKWVSLSHFAPAIYSGNPLLHIRPIHSYAGGQQWEKLIPNDPRKEKLMELRGKLQQLQQPMSLWDTPEEGDFKQISAAIRSLENQIEDPEDFWGSYLDWRDLFPSLWVEKGEFMGFDGIFSAPASIRQEDFQAFNPYLKDNFASFRSQANFYLYLMEVGIRLLRPGGKFGFLSPDKWQSVQYADKFRKWMNAQTIFEAASLPTNPHRVSIPTKHALFTKGIKKYPVNRLGS